MTSDTSAAAIAAIAAVDAAITTRHSMRAYLPTAVPRQMIEDILQVASRAPSGTNIQPWKVHVLTGAAKQTLSARILEVFNDPAAAATHTDDYGYYPKEWLSPYIDRRRKMGWDMYGLLGIQKGDKQRMHDQHGRNYKFFDAPVGLIFTIDRVMQQGSWLDYGTFLQSIMIAARARGLHTCPQVAFMQFHKIILEYLDVPPDQMLVCGMSLGYADPHAAINTLITEREPVEEFTRWRE